MLALLKGPAHNSSQYAWLVLAVALDVGLMLMAAAMCCSSCLFGVANSQPASIAGGLSGLSGCLGQCFWVVMS